MSTIIATVCLAANVFSCTPMEIKVIDGDTIHIRSEKIRVLGIDAPEIKGNCQSEVVLAQKAKRRLADLIGGNQIVIDRQGRDKYRRTLAKITLGNRDIGSILMSEGLARKWESKWRPGLDEIWCSN